MAAYSPTPLDDLRNNLMLERLSERERLNAIDKLLAGPSSPIPKEAVPFFTKEQKLELFKQLVDVGRIR